MTIQLSILKKCRVCGLEAINQKDLEKFKRHKLQHYGRESICNQCENKRARAYKKQHRTEIREKGIEQTKQYNQQHREERREKAKEYYVEYPERVKAGITARRKVSVDKNCSQCGSTEKLERHHSDYSYPEKVVTLCAYCHSQLHHELCGSAIKMASQNAGSCPIPPLTLHGDSGVSREPAQKQKCFGFANLSDACAQCPDNSECAEETIRRHVAI